MKYNQNIHPKIYHCIETMMNDNTLKYYFFGEFMNFVNISRWDLPYIMGVNVSTKGMNLFYNTKMCDGLEQTEVNFVVIHEISHFLYSHYQRTKSGGYEPELANYCQDAIINEVIIKDFDPNFVKIPQGLIRMPKSYTGEHVFEILYTYLEEQRNKYNKEKKQCYNNLDSQNSENLTTEEKLRKSSRPNEKGEYKDNSQSSIHKDERDLFDSIEGGKPITIDKHMLDEIPQELREEIVNNAKTTLKQRGRMTGHVEGILNKLVKKRKDFLKEIKKAYEQNKGYYKERTYARLSRRNIPGLKGAKKYGFAINVILDTSGSMYGYLEKVLNFIFQDNLACNIIIADTEVKKIVSTSTKKQIQDMAICGFGGTQLQPAVDFVKSNKSFKNLNTVILTDGYTDTLDLIGMKKVLIISCDKEVPLKFKTNVKQIIITE